MRRTILFLFVCLAIAMPARAEWLVAETPHFRIHGTIGEKRIRQEAAVLEDFHSLLEGLTRRKFPAGSPRLDIYLVDSRADMTTIWPEMPKDVGGFYKATAGGILAMAEEPGGPDSEWTGGRDVLLHEYAHHFMMQAGSAALPAWYVEGFAEYVATADFRPDRVEFGGYNKGRLYTLQIMPWLPLEQVLARAPNIDQGSFYAQSWLLTHYLNRVEGMGPKRDAYLKLVADGADPAEAFRTAIDPDIRGFQSRLRNYINGRSFTFTRMTRKPPPPASVSITALPPAATDALLPLVSIQLPQKPEVDRRNLARVQMAAARYPDDPWAQRALAIALAAANDPTAAPRLDALLAASPEDAELLRWRAALYRARRPDAPAADVSAARRLLVRAYKAAPNDWRVLDAYAGTFLGRGEPLPESVLDVLGRANELAPQVQAIAVRAGVEMARAGNLDLARAILAPVVNDPHRRATPQQQQLLAALRQKDGKAVEQALAALAGPRPPEPAGSGGREPSSRSHSFTSAALAASTAAR